MTVTVRLFAALREAAGTDRWEIDLPDGATVQELVHVAMVHHPQLAPFRPVVRAAVNDGWAGSDTVLNDGDEVALLSPVSGG